MSVTAHASLARARYMAQRRARDLAIAAATRPAAMMEQAGASGPPPPSVAILPERPSRGACRWCGDHIGSGIGFHEMRCRSRPAA